jgi:hypothetical protein
MEERERETWIYSSPSNHQFPAPGVPRVEDGSHFLGFIADLASGSQRELPRPGLYFLLSRIPLGSWNPRVHICNISGSWIPGPLGKPSNLRWLTLGKPASIKEAAFGRLPQRGRAAPRPARFVGILYGGWFSGHMCDIGQCDDKQHIF